jgi:uncharacterized repeat protein (TIGR03847 family)
MTVFFQFDHADVFTAGTVGKPGRRTFFLQLRSDEHVVTIKCEKQQVVAMAEYLRGLLADLPAPTGNPGATDMELDTTAAQDFVLGPIGLAYDRDIGGFIVQLEEMVVDIDENQLVLDGFDVPEPSDPSTVRAVLTPSQVLAFCQRVDELAAAGRPPCVFCGGPMDPDGHACPRMN